MKEWGFYFPHWKTKITSIDRLKPYLTDKPLDDEDLQYAEFVEKHPKTEIHVHAEACTWNNFYERENQRLRLFESSFLPANRVPFHEFKDFIAAWIDNLKFAEHESFYERLALAVAERQKDCNISYSEVHLSPLDSSILRNRFSPGSSLIKLSLADNILNFLVGLKKAESLFPEVTIRVIIDSLSISTSDDLETLLGVLVLLNDHPLAFDAQNKRFIVGIGLGGIEMPQNIHQHLDFFSKCRELGLKVDLHSGEQLWLKKDDIENARDSAQPERISHGLQFVEDGLRFKGHTAMCPLSNVLTGVFHADLSLHPILTLWKEGASVSVNTDDPLLFGTTLTLEYVALRRALGLGEDFFKKTQANAKQAKISN